MDGWIDGQREEGIIERGREKIFILYLAQRRGSKRGNFNEPPPKKHLFISLSRRGTSSEYAKGKLPVYNDVIITSS